MKTIIIIFGFSGSGKSTIANMLGKKLDLRVVHPSSILKDLILNKEPDIEHSKEGKGFWESKRGIKMFNERLKNDKPIDLDCDQILLKEATKGNLVIDSWSLPWLTKKGIKIYLQATEKTRIARVSKRSRISLGDAQKTLRMKDSKTRELYLKHRGFDIKKDSTVFDLVINTNKLTRKEIVERILTFLKSHANI